LKTSFAGLSIVVALFACQQQADQAERERELAGVWRLVSWQLTNAAGEIKYPYGETPEGQIIYTAGGQMSAQLMYPGAELGDMSGLDSAAAISQVSRTFFAYYGTYTVDEVAGTVTHHVRGCLRPDWVGTDRVRHFAWLDRDRISLSATLEGDTTVPGENVLVWERVE
jgi:hypothetical protein